jgi:hypothetical protein
VEVASKDLAVSSSYKCCVGNVTDITLGIELRSTHVRILREAISLHENIKFDSRQNDRCYLPVALRQKRYVAWKNSASFHSKMHGHSASTIGNLSTA